MPLLHNRPGTCLGTSDVWESSLKLGPCLGSSVRWILNLNPKLFLTVSMFSLECISSEHWPTLTYFVQDLIRSQCKAAGHKLQSSIWLLSDKWMWSISAVCQVLQPWAHKQGGVAGGSPKILSGSVQMNRGAAGLWGLWPQVFRQNKAPLLSLATCSFLLGPSVVMSILNVWSLSVNMGLLDIQKKCFTLKATLCLKSGPYFFF